MIIIFVESLDLLVEYRKIPASTLRYGLKNPTNKKELNIPPFKTNKL